MTHEALRKNGLRSTALTVALLVLLFNVTHGSDTVPIDPNMPSFTIKTNAGSNTRDRYALCTQHDLAVLGVEVIIDYMEWGTFLGDVFSGNTQAFVLGWGIGKDPDWSDIYHSEGYYNFYFLNDSLNDELLEAGLAAVDPYERREIYNQWQEHFMNDLLPIIPIDASYSYVCNWAHLDGYDSIEGLPASLPQMRWSEPSQRETSDDIIVSTFADAMTLFDLHVADTSSREVTDMLFPRLVEYNGDMLIEENYENSLSSVPPSIQITEDGKAEFTFCLREDLYWEDGVQINSTDVEFMWDCILNYNQTGYPYTSTYNGVLSDNSTETIGEFVYRITFPTVYGPDYYDLAGTAILPAHILNLRNATGHELFDGIQDTHVWQEFAKHPLSGGAWYLDHWIEDEEITLKLRDDNSSSRGFSTNIDALSTAFVNDSMNGVTGFNVPSTPNNTPWWNEDSYTIKTWIRRVMSDIDVEMSQLFEGNIDLTQLDQEYVPEISADSRFEIQSIPSFGLSYIGFNMNDSLLGTGEDTPVGSEGNGGLHLRKAIAYAIDKQTMIDEVRQGHGQVAHSPMYAAQAFWYHPVVYEHDLDKAAEEMAAAGYFVTLATPSETGVTEVISTSGRFVVYWNFGSSLAAGMLALILHRLRRLRRLRRRTKARNTLCFTGERGNLK